VIAPSAREPRNYRFIIDRYKRLKGGEIRVSGYHREIQKLGQQPGRCVFCEKLTRTVPTEVIPRHPGGPVGIHNTVHACAAWAKSKGDQELVRWWRKDLGRDKDELPRIPAGLFLKLAYEHHSVSFSLEEYCDNIRDLWPE
jgi:hypothetical protein